MWLAMKATGRLQKREVFPVMESTSKYLPHHIVRMGPTFGFSRSTSRLPLHFGMQAIFFAGRGARGLHWDRLPYCREA